MLKVVKFGGSSLSEEKQFKKVYDIVKSDSERRIVVVSALGKRDSHDSKITDLLYILHAHIKFSVPYDDIWNMIEKRFIDVKESLKLDFDIKSELDHIHSELKKGISEDYLVSRGEYLTAKLMASYLGYTFKDAKDLIKFDYEAKIDYDKTEPLVKEAFITSEKIVVPGFYGSYPNGDIKLLSRGGSDVTGSILAKSIHADLYENWTDVSGILVADPRIVENPMAIKEITYHELRELSYMGANVLHEETIFPIQSLNIPINIKNTNRPMDSGTLILDECSDNTQPITGIAGKKNFISFSIFKNHMSNEIGYVRKVLSLFERYNVSIEHIPTGIDTVSIVCSADSVEKYKYEIVQELKSSLGADNVSVMEELSLIAVVGRNMKGYIGLSGKLFSVLGEEKINVRMIAQGPEEINIILGIDTKDYDRTIRLIYDNLIR